MQNFSNYMYIVGRAKGIAGRVINLLGRKNYGFLSTQIFRKFPDGEQVSQFQDISIESNARAAVILEMERGRPDEYIIRLLQISDILTALECEKKLLFLLYFPYARQDKRFREDRTIKEKKVIQSFSKRLITTLLLKGEYSYDTIFTIDSRLNHLIDNEKSFQKELSAMPIFAEYFSIYNLQNPCVVGTDDQGLLFAKKLAETIRIDDYSALEKERRGDKEVKVLGWSGTPLSLRDRDVIIPDDIWSTGETLLAAINFILKENPKRIFSACSHQVGTHNIEKILGIKKVISYATTNSIIPDIVSENKKAVCLDVAPLISSEISKLINYAS